MSREGKEKKHSQQIRRETKKSLWSLQVHTWMLVKMTPFGPLFIQPLQYSSAHLSAPHDASPEKSSPPVKIGCCTCSSCTTLPLSFGMIPRRSSQGRPAIFSPWYPILLTIISAGMVSLSSVISALCDPVHMHVYIHTHILGYASSILEYKEKSMNIYINIWFFLLRVSKISIECNWIMHVNSWRGGGGWSRKLLLEISFPHLLVLSDSLEQLLDQSPDRHWSE